jgi:hypothetical protein
MIAIKAALTLITFAFAIQVAVANDGSCYVGPQGGTLFPK